MSEKPKVFIVAPAETDVERYANKLRKYGINVVGASRGYLDDAKTPLAIVHEIRKHPELHVVIIFGWISGNKRNNSEGKSVADLVRLEIPNVETIGVVDPHDKGKLGTDRIFKISDFAGIMAAAFLSNS